MKIFIFGAPLKNNLGGPSIFYGLDIILNEVFPGSKAIYYQTSSNELIEYPENKVIKRAKIVNHNPKKTLLFAYLYKLTRLKLFKNNSILYDLLTSDIIINAWGIQFADKFGNRENESFSMKSFIGTHIFEYIGKMFNKKVISNTKSFGPIIYEVTKKNIALYAESYCDLLLCREEQSKHELNKLGITENIITTLDTGLLMPMSKCEMPFLLNKKNVIISVSYQIINQWESKVSYIDVIKALIKKIVDDGNCNVLLLPNETQRPLSYNDFDVAVDIKNEFQDESVEIVDFDKYNPTQIKYLISQCDMMVASRYHSVVASLSSNVPTFVIGWHYKYIELLSHYNQEEYLISHNDCNIDNVEDLFDHFAKNTVKIKKEITLRNETLMTEIINTAQSLKSI